MPTPELDYCTIPLTKGQFAKVSPEDFESLNQWKWFAVWSIGAQSYYAARQVSLGGRKQRHMRMHRQILGLEWGDTRQGDHANHDTLDNRRENLRIATPTQQQWNTRTQKNNKCGLKGVSWHKQKSRWRAGIRLNGHDVHLGYFDTPEQAHAAYCEASKKSHGEFSQTL